MTLESLCQKAEPNYDYFLNLYDKFLQGKKIIEIQPSFNLLLKCKHIDLIINKFNVYAT